MTTMTHTPFAGRPVQAWMPPQQAAARAQAAGFGVGDFVRVVRQRMFLVLFVTLAGFGMAVGLTFLAEQYFPKYSVSNMVEIRSLQAPNPDDPLEKASTTSQDADRLIKDQSLIAVSAPVLQLVLKDPDVREARWFKEVEAKFKQREANPLELMIDELNDTITVEPIRLSNLMRVSAETNDPRSSKVLVDSLIRNYVDYVDARAKRGYEGQEIDLKERRDRLVEYQNAVQQKMRLELEQNPFIRQVLMNQRTTDDENVLMYNALVNQFDTETLNWQHTADILNRYGLEGLQANADLLASVEGDPLISDYRKDLSNLEQARTNLSARLLPGHPRMKEIDRQISDLMLKLDEARRGARQRLAQQEMNNAKNNWAKSQMISLDINEKYQAAVHKQRDQQAILRRYQELQAEWEARKEVLDDLNYKLDQLSAIVTQDRRVRILTPPPAPEPKRMSQPNWPIWLGVGGLLSLLCGLGLAFLLEFTDTSVRTTRDLVRHTGLSVLGAVPNADDEEVEIERVETATMTAPQSVIAEAFRQMRTNLFFAAPPEQQAALLITSPSPGDGKTTVAVNLACAIASSGRRVLLADANFRRPTLRTFFPEARAEGLSNVLVGQSRPVDVISPTSVPGLDVLTAGPVPPNPAELLGGGYLRSLITDARAQGYQIIIDGPPLLLMSDALVLAGAVDGVIVVCRFRRTSRGALLRAKMQLDGINAHVLGAALNAVEITRGGYFRKQYREFYDYASESPAALSTTLPPPPAPPTLRDETAGTPS